MPGHVSRPIPRESTPRTPSWTAAVLVAVLVIVGGCAGPAPSIRPGTSPDPGGTPPASRPASTAPGSPGASGNPSAEPPASAEPTAPPAAADWTAGVIVPPLQPVARFEPTRAGVAGVEPDTAFRLTALDGSDPVALARQLVAEPSVDLAVTAAAGAAVVTPAQPLLAGVAYRFTLRAPDGTVGGTWAVQAIGPLAVVDMLPGDETTDVPLDTGIEVRFNQSGVGAADLERHLEIRPATAGRIEVAGRTAAFIPDRPLAKATLYTVTVRAGLPLAGTDETLQRDAVARFETAGVRPAAIALRASRALVEATPDERAAVHLALYREDESATPHPDHLAVTAHRLPTLDAAIDAWRAIDAAPSWSRLAPLPVPTDGLELALEGDAPLHRVNEWDDWEQYLLLPAPLPAGWYVVTAHADSGPVQAVLQVTSLALYTVVTSTRTLAWVNDLAAHGPVPGVAVTVAGVALGTTGADGIATGRTPRRVLREDAGPFVVVARSASGTVFAPGGDRACEKCTGSREASPWWLVFAPDRWQYRATDTINAWGLVRDRETGRVPDRVEVTLDAWSEATRDATPVARATATPDRTGAFVVSLPVRELPYGSYELSLHVGGRVVSAPSITVTRILKPAWAIAMETSRHAIVDGGSVTARVSAAFYEGTPVAGAEIRVSADQSRATLITDATGTGSAKVRPRLEGDWGQWDILRVNARPVLPEEGEVGGGAWVAVFRAGVLLRSEPVVEDGRLRVAGSVHRVAFARFEDADPASPWDVDPYGRTVAGATVQVRVVEHRAVRTETGTRYDWILKRVVPRYEYTDRATVLGTWTVDTDADGRFSLDQPASEDRSYEVVLRTSDPKGRVTRLEAWAEAPAAEPSATEARITGPETETGHGVGDGIRFAFEGGPGAGEPATYLWTTAHAGLRSWAVTDEPRYRDTFGADDVPGFFVNAVRFTGTGYAVAHSEWQVPFRLEHRALDIRLVPDRSRYAPGDTVTLDVRTADTRGRPVAASVYVTVVDEKLVALGGVNDADPLHALYASVGSGIVGISWSHRGPADGGGEGGDTTGGGGDDVRSDFRDWLVAQLVRTGSDGRGRLSFRLSDDLTSWHAFASGATRSLLAGRGDTRIAVSLPFFAEFTVAEQYLASDRPIVRVRGYGTGLGASDTVTFTVSSDTLPLAAVTVTAPAFRAAEVALPALTPGTHRLRVVARTGAGETARRDTLVRTFEVVASRAVAGTVTRATLTGPMTLAAGEGLTTVVFADGGRGRVVPLLESLALADPARGDRALAATLAARVLRDTFGEEPPASVLDRDLAPFTRDGFSILPYGGSGIDLVALAALSGEPGLGDVAGTLTWRETTTREERIWALAGLAAAGAPVLGEIRAAADRSDLTVDEEVALAVAALAAGDDALAAGLERDVLRDHGERTGPWVRVAGNDDEAGVLTARLAIVAASLGDTVAADMDAYLEANPPRTTIVDLERALAARGWARRVPPATATATLTVDGVGRTIRVEASQPVRVVLTPAQARGATLSPVSGSVVVAIRSASAVDPASLAAPDWLTPDRAVTPARDQDVADTFVVELRMAVPTRESEGCWLVTEFVPSGLVPIGRGSGWDGDEDDGASEGEGPWSIQGQRLDFCLQPHREGGRAVLRYVARVVTPGTYTWEPAVVQSPLDPTVGTVIPGPTITIRGER